LRAPGKKKGRRIAPPVVSARLSGHVTLEVKADGAIAACFDGYSVGLGKFSSGVAKRALELRTGLALASFATGRAADKEIDLVVRRLAQSGLLEYRFGHPRSEEDQVVIEPQVADYWPQTPKLGNKDVIALSRFAYLRRRGNEMVLESPRAGALFQICDPDIAAALAVLSVPQKIGTLRGEPGFPGLELLALLVDCQILFKIEAAKGDGLRSSEGPRALGFSRPSVPYPQHGGTAGQPARRALSICRSHPRTAGGTAALARRGHRSAQALGHAS
jgi:hypothetical protein